jgi:hypothetical protein
MGIKIDTIVLINAIQRQYQISMFINEYILTRK